MTPLFEYFPITYGRNIRFKKTAGRIGIGLNLGANSIGFLPDGLGILDTLVNSAYFDRVGEANKPGELVHVIELIPLDGGQLLHEVYPVLKEVLNKL